MTGRAGGWKLGLAGSVFDIFGDFLWPILLIGLIGWLIGRMFQRAEVVR